MLRSIIKHLIGEVKRLSPEHLAPSNDQALLQTATLTMHLTTPNYIPPATPAWPRTVKS